MKAVPFGRSFFAFLLSRAEDFTSQTATRSCLVLAPHPEDETLDCGATVLRKLAAGATVHVVTAADAATRIPQASWPLKR
jgi:LmbE family N-acetylglucosaminyl deacetylase